MNFALWITVLACETQPCNGYTQSIVDRAVLGLSENDFGRWAHVMLANIGE